MDSSQNINTVEWFFGYGGNHLGLKRVIPNLRLVAACEIEAYALANMVAKMEAGLLDSAPVWSDCKTFPAEPFQDRIDLFIASYPCQGFSSAGKRLGADDPRYLWPWVLEWTKKTRPRRCFFENVEGHVSLGLSTVLSDLEEIGYTTAWGIFSAAECGAPHQRKRVFILADYQGGKFDGEGQLLSPPRDGREDIRGGGKEGHSVGKDVADARGEESGGLSGGERQKILSTRGTSALANTGPVAHCAESQIQPSERTEEFHRSSELADAPGERKRESDDEARSVARSGPWQSVSRRSSSFFWPGFVSRPGQSQSPWEPPRVIQTVRGLGGGVNGRASNVDRLRLLGNGVYPATAAKAYVTLDRELRGLPAIAVNEPAHTHTHTHTTGKQLADCLRP